MTNTVTLRQLTGMSDEPPALSKAAVVMVDCQNTYTRGVMELEGVQEALDVAAELLDRARTVGAPVIHIMHDAGVGTPFDVSAEIGQIIDRVAPRDDESIIVKNYPNSFVGTDLDKQIRGLGAEDVILAGFMTHMCINSTTRGAFSLGYRPTVIGGATATRALPSGVDAASLQAASLAAIADLFGVVVPDVRALRD